jgi:glycosyltransferase involved in cell wall biosynthesis
MLSVVIPIHNEEPSILPLYDRLTAVLESIQKPYEIIAVDDASTDLICLPKSRKDTTLPAVGARIA